MTPLFKKMNLADQETILVLNAPDSFEAELSQLEGIKILRKVSAKIPITFSIGFAITLADLERTSTQLAQACIGDAIVWIAYPKGTSKKYKCEFNRDSGWATLSAAGFESVRQVAIDEDWSALRFRRTEFVKKATRIKQAY